MKTLPITWRRFVDAQGRTCERCGATQRELQKAVSKLRGLLQPHGIEPALELEAMDRSAFEADPSESNRVWIAGRPLEEWLDARVGSSRCCSVCGDAPCRTLDVGGRRFETIPEAMIVEAALAACSR